MATHIVSGNVLDALGFPPPDATVLKIQSELLSAILERVREQGYTQAQLIALLDEYQPSVSNLLKGRIAQVSMRSFCGIRISWGLKRSSL